MNDRMLGIMAGIAVFLLLVTLGVYFFFKPTVTIEPMTVYEVPARLPALSQNTTASSQIRTDSAPVVADVPDTYVASHADTINDEANLSAWDAFLDEETAAAESAPAYSDEMLAALNPPVPPPGGFVGALEDATEDTVEDIAMAYFTRHYPLVAMNPDLLSGRAQVERQRQSDALDREMDDLVQRAFSEVTPEVLQYLSDYQLETLRKEGLIK